MGKNRLLLLAIVFTALCLSFYFKGNFNSSNSIDEFTSIQFSIIHSSNLRGETEPCG